MKMSALQLMRAAYKPQIPKALEGAVRVEEETALTSADNQETIKKLFPCTYGMPLVKFVPAEKMDHPKFNVGVILSGGQAPGGHNVICGLFDEIKRINPENRMYGFLMGPEGLIEHNYKELTKDIIDQYRNTGGFDMIGSGRTKLETEEQFRKGADIMHQLGIKALVIIGGDDSNTNAAFLAEYYKAHHDDIQVIGVPKTIDGDMKSDIIEASFGFDTATKTYSEVIGNVERDCDSARKYWHFIKLMGRSASHIALECALETRPNICIISEEIKEKDYDLNDIVNMIARVVVMRAKEGMNYGVVLVPEGLIEFIPAIGRLIGELNELLAAHGDEYRDLPLKQQRKYILEHLSPKNKATYETLPDNVARQLAMDRDPHGNVQVSLIETEQLLSHMVAAKLAKMKAEGKYNGKFAAQHHFFGYEGRCAFPSNYDANYCYALGISAAHLILNGKTGYMTYVRNTWKAPSEWEAGGVPLVSMMNIERRNGEDNAVIKKKLVDLNGKPFKYFASRRARWAHDTAYIYPGPLQYLGPSELCDRCTLTLKLEHDVPIQ